MPAFFGIDIGSSSVKIASVSGGSVDARIVANPIGKIGLSVSLSDKSILVGKIKKELRAMGVKNRQVVLSMPEQLVFSRVMTFPVMSDPELATAIKWELDQVSPYPINDMEYSWVVMSRPKRVTGEEKMKVLVVAAPKRVVQDYIEFSSLLDLQLLRLENEAFSLVRSVLENRKISGTSLVLDVGYSATKMLLVSDGMVRSIHSISIAGAALTRLLAETFSISLDQAEQYKIVYGVDQNLAEGKILKALSPLLQEMVTEIKKMVLSWVGEKVENKVDRLVLVGGGSLLKGFVPYLVDQTGLDVMISDPLNGYKNNVGEKSVMFAGAIGLAID